MLSVFETKVNFGLYLDSILKVICFIYANIPIIYTYILNSQLLEEKFKVFLVPGILNKGYPSVYLQSLKLL